MAATLTSLGNAGVALHAGGAGVAVDGFFFHLPDVGGAPLWRGADAFGLDLILVTHMHPDHFLPHEVAAAARKTGALVAGPETVRDRLRRQLPPEQLHVFDAGRGTPATATLGPATVTAFRTWHSPDHHSYLVELDGCRLYHDGDNERCNRLDPAALGRVDALCLCPWRGSGAGKFVEALQPVRWFLTHLTPEEIAQHRAGTFLPDLLDTPPPPNVTALMPGERAILGSGPPC